MSEGMIQQVQIQLLKELAKLHLNLTCRIFLFGDFVKNIYYGGVFFHRVIIQTQDFCYGTFVS